MWHIEREQREPLAAEGTRVTLMDPAELSEDALVAVVSATRMSYNTPTNGSVGRLLLASVAIPIGTDRAIA